MEIWKEIKDYPNYEISSFGNCRNIKTNKILKPRYDKYGYVKYMLYNNNIPKQNFAHRLVGIAFIPNPENKPQIDHIIRNEKANNNIINLRWATVIENSLNRKKGILNEKYIYTTRNNKYMVLIRKNNENNLEYNKVFETFEEAKNIRDSFI